MVTYQDYAEDDKERLHPESERSNKDARGPFERDRARIIHSAAFRRLQGKTQVYGLGASDYYRTRLTHSLEVAQIGKAIALRLDADPTLVEAICLAHDIGHPPFGHAGEEALHAEMMDVDGFNGNAQNIRILTHTERKDRSYAGLNLTKATLDGLIKYPRPITQNERKGYYRSDASLVASFRDPALPSDKTFECAIMNWSDDVAYSSHDLEDALVIGTVRQEDLENPAKLSLILSFATKSYGADYLSHQQERPINESDVEELAGSIIKQCMSAKSDRIAGIKTFVGNHINDCAITPSATKRQHPWRRYQRTLGLPGDIVRRVEILKAITFACVIKTNSVLTLQHAGRKVVTELYRVFSNHNDGDIRYFYPDDWLDRVDEALTAVRTEVDVLALKRLARDYIATMTDRFAEEQWRRLYQPGEGPLFIARA